jgi:hypothetical protein
MIPALVICAVSGNLLAGVVSYLAYRERRSLVAAALQANGHTSAARRVADSEPSKAMVKAEIEMQKELIENGGVFSAQNPFGNIPPKPHGV